MSKVGIEYEQKGFARLAPLLPPTSSVQKKTSLWSDGSDPDERNKGSTIAPCICHLIILCILLSVIGFILYLSNL